MVFRPRLLVPLLCACTLLYAKGAWADADVIPVQGGASNANPSVSISPADAANTIKKAAEAQGDISPQTRKALSGDPRMNEQATPAKGPSAQGSKQQKSAGKAIYGDIIIHK